MVEGTLTLDNRVVVITGAAGGLGKAHALLLARYGAKVVVNDLGTLVDGDGSDTTAASAVVDEIRAAGGEAIADTNSVTTPEGGQAIIDAAIEAFGHVDVIVNNAGILRDKTFQNMTAEFVDPVFDVHLRGAFNVTRPAWVHFREQGHGRIINTSSAAGILGNFGQANYGAAKAGLVGFTNVLAIEGAKYHITSNVIAPIARTRMTEDLLGKLVDKVAPELVSPLVVWLASDECQETGRVYSVGGGRVARFFTAMSDGWTRTDGALTPEDVRDHWDQINDESKYSVPDGIADDFKALRDALRDGD
ncbi:MAG TPA: SDR family oxidoreductase [Acidimicrobiales bacterium]|jgi:NAD(P)-dependent dehydrogenase (short-subunit alcohol dehydrogenase family)|nr:SDR family oxidoreductase [Acidimicrobiales bacterium]